MAGTSERSREFEPRGGRRPGPRARPPSRGRTVWRAAPAVPIALTAVGLAGCAGAPRSGPGSMDGSCVVLDHPSSEAGGTSFRSADGAAAPEPGELPRPIAVGLSAPVDPSRAPVPRTSSERLVFRQLYQTLVDLACDGRVIPQLAETWRADDDGRRWTFTLNAGAVDWDGRPVSAADVAESWSRAAPSAAADPMTRFVSMSVRDPHTLSVELNEPVTIGFFAHPALAVSTGPGEGGWPRGTGPYRPASANSHGETSRGGPLLLEPVPTRDGETSGPRLEFRSLRGDPRNALDAGLDLLIATSPAVVDYARSVPSLRAVPLAWSRSYLLVVEGAGVGADSAEGEDPATWPAFRVRRPPETVLEGLARDVVGGGARPARTVTDELTACGAGDSARASAESASTGDARVAGTFRATERQPRIAYGAADPVARALAERLVALALRPERSEGRWLAEAAPELAAAGASVRATGLPPRALAARLRAGMDAATVVSIARGPSAACGDPPVLTAPSERSGPRVIVPLVETRSTLIARRGVGGVAIDGTGTLRLEAIRRFPAAVEGRR